MKNGVLKSKGIPLKTKMAMLIAAALVISNIALTFITLQNVNRQMKAQIEESGMTLAKEIYRSARDMDTFEGIIDSILAEKILSASKVINHLNMQSVNNDFLKGLADDLGVSEINIVGADRKILISNVDDYIGWEYPKEHAMSVLFDHKQTDCMEAIRENPIDKKFYKFGGVILDNGYFVQVGISADMIGQLKSNMGIQSLLSEIEQNKSVMYALRIDENGKAVEGTQSMIGTTYDDKTTIDAIKNGKEGANEYFDKKLGVEVYEVQIPFYKNDELKGSLAIGLSLEGLKKANSLLLVKSLIMTAVVIAISSLLMIYIIRRLLSPVNMAAVHMQTMSSGDFTASIPEKYMDVDDEIGSITRALLSMQQGLKALILNVIDSSDQLAKSSLSLSKITDEVTTAINENANAVESLAMSSTTQAHDANEASQNSNLLGSKIEDSSKLILKTMDIAASTEDLSKQGKHIIGHLNEKTVSSIEKTVQIESLITEIEHASKDTENIISLIENISGQTNLLALNASIEAARAGEAGKGFSVVADEIRSLSEGTKQATENIRTLISSIQCKVQNAVSEMNTVRTMTNEQYEVLMDTDKIFNDISTSVNTLLTQLDVVNNHSNEISLKKDEIINAVGKISDVTEDFSATAEEISASTEQQAASMHEVSSLAEKNRELSDSLRSFVDNFKI